jgi:hypothetical protein
MAPSVVHVGVKITLLAPCVDDTVLKQVRAGMASQFAGTAFPERRFHTIAQIADKRHLAAAVPDVRAARRRTGPGDGRT